MRSAPLPIALLALLVATPAAVAEVRLERRADGTVVITGSSTDSRPAPVSLTPPEGLTSVRNPGPSLTTTPPTTSRSTAAKALTSDAGKTQAWRP